MPVGPRRKSLLFGISALLLGVFALAAFRFAFAPPDPPIHYHASFAIFLEGERLDLSDDRYMQDVAACAGEAAVVPPPSRVHLHNNNPDIVHVHHGGATWGHLLANLRLILGDQILMTRDGDLFREGEGKTLKFILNGRPEFSVYNEMVRSGDRLLISYGAESEEEILRSQFPAVASDAEEYNERRDPAGCGGPEEPIFWDRLRHAFIG